MDYHSMTLVDLKKAARDLPKGHKIKRYYIKSRHELIQLLTVPELPRELIIEKLTLVELREQAKEKGIPNIWKYRRHQLQEMLYPSSQKNNENNDDRKKHNHPEDSEGEDVRIDV